MPVAPQGYKARIAVKVLCISVMSLAIIRVLLALRLDLFGDEAFYWQASQHLAWAYSDLPGMTAWLVAAGVSIFGHDEWAVRLSFLILGTCLPLALVWSGSPAVGRKDALWGAAALATIPLLALNGLLSLPDVLLLLLSILAMGALLRALDGSRRAWLLLGVILALGFLCHYRAAVIAGCAALAVLLTDPGRRALRSPWPWISAVVALTGLIPIAFFNLRHDAAGVSFQLLDRHPWTFQPEGLVQPLVQALATTPLVYVALIISGILLLRRWTDLASQLQVLAVFAWLPVLGFFILGLFADQQRSNVHWPLQGYLPLLLLLPSLMRKVPRWLAGLAVASGLAGTVMFSLYLWWLPVQRVPNHEWLPLPDTLVGWRQVSEQTDAFLKASPGETFLAADNFVLGAQLAFAQGDPRSVYVLNHPRNVKHGRALQYRLWNLDEVSLREAKSQRTLLVQEEDSLAFGKLPGYYRSLCRRFRSVEPISQLRPYGGRRSFRFYWIERTQIGQCHTPPVVYLDSPGNNAQVHSTLHVRGWAFGDTASVSRVEVLVDGQVLDQASYGFPRPEVPRLFSQSQDPSHPNVGFEDEFELGRLAPGYHIVSVRAFDTEGVVSRTPDVVIEISEGFSP